MTKKEINAKYNSSEKGRKKNAEYQKSAAGIAARKRYQQTAKFKAVRKRQLLAPQYLAQRKAYAAAYIVENMKKIKAEAIARRAHKVAQTCSIKGCEAIGERHHPNYTEPTKVIWLCRKHHMEVHGKARGTCHVCRNPHYAKGLCRRHYTRKLREMSSLIKHQ